jgi:hypothetical protein
MAKNKTIITLYVNQEYKDRVNEIRKKEKGNFSATVWKTLTQHYE